MMHIIIAGCRDFNDYAVVEKEVMNYIGKFIDKVEIEIISGGASGVDALGERFAKEHNLGLKVVPADWKTYGRSAGPRRNEQMARMAGTLIAFWDGKSNGTKHMIEIMENKKLLVRVVNYETSDKA